MDDTQSLRPDLCCFAGVVASDLAKEKTRCGTWQYWLIVASIVPVVVAITSVVRVYLMRRYKNRVAADYEWTEGEIEWTPRNTIVYPLICSLAGALRCACVVCPKDPVQIPPG